MFTINICEGLHLMISKYTNRLGFGLGHGGHVFVWGRGCLNDVYHDSNNQYRYYIEHINTATKI